MEQTDINKLRAQVSDLNKDGFENSDVYLSKWLRQTNFNISAAERNLRNSDEWRKVNGINHILNENMQEVSDKFPIDMKGYDKFGRPLLYFIIEGWNIKNYLNNKGGANAFVRYTTRKFEEMYQAVKRQYTGTGGQVHQYIQIVDMGNVSMRNVCSTSVISASMELAKIFDANYPEACKVSYIINAPMFASVLFKAIKPFLSPATKAALKIYDCNKEVWKTELLKIMEPCQLPKSALD